MNHYHATAQVLMTVSTIPFIATTITALPSQEKPTFPENTSTSKTISSRTATSTVSPKMIMTTEQEKDFYHVTSGSTTKSTTTMTMIAIQSSMLSLRRSKMTMSTSTASTKTRTTMILTKPSTTLREQQQMQSC